MAAAVSLHMTLSDPTSWQAVGTCQPESRIRAPRPTQGDTRRSNPKTLVYKDPSASPYLRISCLIEHSNIPDGETKAQRDLAIHPRLQPWTLSLAGFPPPSPQLLPLSLSLPAAGLTLRSQALWWPLPQAPQTLHDHPQNPGHPTKIPPVPHNWFLPGWTCLAGLSTGPQAARLYVW